MVIDGHIHIGAGAVNGDDLKSKMDAAGIDGGVILSLEPNRLKKNEAIEFNWTERLDNLFAWSKTNPNLYPFYWIDPTETNASEQVSEACDRGVYGFKVICSNFFPSDERALNTYKSIAKAGKPILFHSGILWDGMASSKYNRPGEFEVLLNIDGLKFSLAHVSWPWYDENIAVYGKFLNAYTRRPDLSVEMFIDLTPGTPVIYREEVLTKLFTVGYDIENNVIFGTDCNVNNYNHKWAVDWVQRDNAIYDKIGINQNIKQKIYSENLKRFLGISKEKVEKVPLKVGE